MARFSDLLGDGDDADDGTTRPGDAAAPGSVDPPGVATPGVTTPGVTTPEEILERMARRGDEPASDGRRDEQLDAPVEDTDADDATPRHDRSVFARLARETAYAAASSDRPVDPNDPGPADGAPTVPQDLPRVDDDLLPRGRRRR